MSIYIYVERAERRRTCPECKRELPKGTFFITGQGYRDYGRKCLDCIRNRVTAIVKGENNEQQDVQRT